MSRCTRVILAGWVALLSAGLSWSAEEAAAPAGQEVTLESVRVRLAQALSELGVPSDQSREEVAQRLERVAKESADLAQKLPDPAAQLEARNLEMQAYNALANQARLDEKQTEASYRVGQMRSAAWGAKSIPSPAAGTIGDFWLLQADLFDLGRSIPDQDAQQEQATLRLQRFLTEQKSQRPEGDKLSRQVVTEVKLSLLRLYDRRGRSDAAAELIDELRAAPDCDAATKAVLDEWFAYRQVLGQPFEAALKTTDGQTWNSGEKSGKVLLLHFGASWYEASVSAVEPIGRAVEKYGERGLSVLTVDVGGEETSATAGTGEPDGLAQAVGGRWPIYRQGPGQVNLQRMFSVKSLPRFVLIDPSGHVSAIGGGPAILLQIEPMLPKPTPTPDP